MATMRNVTFDCEDTVALATFWAAVLGREVSPDHNEFFALLPGSPRLLFLKVPEGKTVKNRVHLDLDCADLDAEHKRLIGLGATLLHEKDEFGLRWMTFADPEGNEFCAAHH